MLQKCSSIVQVNQTAFKFSTIYIRIHTSFTLEAHMNVRRYTYATTKHITRLRPVCSLVWRPLGGANYGPNMIPTWAPDWVQYGYVLGPNWAHDGPHMWPHLGTIARVITNVTFHTAVACVCRYISY